MKCYYHPTKEAVATCKNCGKGLCKECFDESIDGLCVDCLVEGLAEYKKELVKGIIYISIFLVCLIAGLILYSFGKSLGIVLMILGAELPAINTASKIINPFPQGKFNLFLGILALIITEILVPFMPIAYTIILIVRIVRFSKIKKLIG